MATPIKRHEALLTALKSLNTLTRMIQDLDEFTAARDLKNIAKAQNRVDADIDTVKRYYDPSSQNPEESNN